MSVGPAVPQLREVRGPSALGGGARRFWDLLWLMSVTEFKRTYFGTVLGYFWSLLRPLILFGVLLFVFTKIFRLGSTVPNYAEMLLFNIVLFGFFQETTVTAVTSVLNQEGVVRKTQFPRLVIPLSVVLTGVMNLGLNMLAVLGFILAFGVEPTWTWLLLPVILLLLLVLTVAVAMIVSALYVRYRDVLIIWTIASTVLFYGTPILYPINIPSLSTEIRTLIQINPLAPIFEQARVWIIDPTAPGAIEAAGSVKGLIAPAVIYLGICGLAWWVFNREAPRVAEAL